MRGKIPLPNRVLWTQLRFVDVDGGGVGGKGAANGKKGGGREFRVVGCRSKGMRGASRRTEVVT